MCRFKTVRCRRVLVFLSLFVTPFVAPVVRATPRPEVLSVLAVVHDDTGSLDRYADFPGEFDKVLPAEDELIAGDVLWSSQEPDDFGWLQVRSRLTGQILVHATIIWSGMGEIEQPPPAAFRHTWGRVTRNPQPLSFRVLPVGGGSPARALELWQKVLDTDFVARVASSAPHYEVVAVRHAYSTGGMSANADWYFFIMSRPQAPLDASLVQSLWPRG